MYPQPVNQPSILSPTVILYSEDYVPGSRSGEWSVDETRCNRSYSVKLKAYVANKYAGPIQVIGSIGVQIGSFYQSPLFASFPTERDTGSFLQRIHAEQQTEDSLQWIVTLDYAPFDVVHQLGVSDIGYGIVCPTDRAWKVWWENAKYERTKTEDETPAPDGPIPFQNTIGDPLLDPPATEETRPILNIARIESTYNDAYASQFKDTVNRDEFLGYPPNTVKCKDIKGERDYDPDWGYFFLVTYQFEFRDDDDGKGYTTLVLNAGYRQKVNGAGDPVNVVDSQGNQVTDAVPLQEDGRYKPGADPYFLEFTMFPAADFGEFQFPDDLLQQDS